MNNLLPLPVLLPLLGAGLALVLGRYPKAQRATSATVSSECLSPVRSLQNAWSMRAYIDCA